MSKKRQGLAPSWLELKDHLPVRDLRKYLYARLDDGDFYMVQLAHGCKPSVEPYKAAVAMIRNEYTWLLPLLGDTNDVAFYVTRIAPVLGKVRVLDWLRVFDPGHKYKLSEIVIDAARHGQVSVLEWLGKPGKYTLPIASAAIDNHHILILEWLFKKELSVSEIDRIYTQICFRGAKDACIPLMQFAVQKSGIIGHDSAARLLFQSAMAWHNMTSFKWLIDNVQHRPDFQFSLEEEEFRVHLGWTNV
jgi:hypothetical protein